MMRSANGSIGRFNGRRSTFTLDEFDQRRTYSPTSANDAVSDSIFFDPTGVAVDSAGSVYVADQREHAERLDRETARTCRC